MTSKTLKPVEASSDTVLTSPITVRDASKSLIELIREELDGYYDEMKRFDQTDPEDVFMLLAGWSARMSEVRGQLQRGESRSRTALRTREVEKFLEEIDRQFRTWSRIQACREFDLKMTGKIT